MSRVGKHAIQIPSGTDVKLEGQTLIVKGKLGVVTVPVHEAVDLAIAANEVSVTPKSKTKTARAMWGTTQRLVKNAVNGVSQGFTRTLDINGVGYRAAVQGKNLQLNLGYSHEILYPIPEGLTIACPKPTQITITGFNKQLIGQVAAEIRSYRKPEPYKGKGIKYDFETIYRKEGKKK